MKKNLKMFLLIVVCILILVLFYFVLKNKQKEDKNFNLNLPDKVEINNKNELVVENNYLFKITDKTQKIEYKNNILAVYEEDFLPSYTFTILENKDNLSLIDWLDMYNQKYLLIYFENKEFKKIKDKELYKIKIEGDPESYNYYINGKNSKIYVFSTYLPEVFEKLLEDFNVIENI